MDNQTVLQDLHLRVYLAIEFISQIELKQKGSHLVNLSIFYPTMFKQNK